MRHKKKIVIWESSRDFTGGQRVALNIAESLRRKYDCMFFIPARGEFFQEIEKRDIAFEILPIGQYGIGEKKLVDILRLLIYFPTTLFRTVLMIKKFRPDIIYSNGAITFIWSALVGRFFSIPVIWHIHNSFISEKSLIIINILAKLGKVSKIIFASHFSFSQFPLLAHKSEIIHNGIDIKTFKLKSLSSSYFRNEFNINFNVKIISTIGWIGKQKNQQLIIKAIPYVISRRKDVHFVVIGNTLKGEEEYYDDLLIKINQLGIKNYVTFTGQRSDIPMILKDVYINTINSIESFPLVMLETSTFGIPTASADIGGVREFIDDKITGLLYTFNNEEELAKSILLLLQDERFYSLISSNCRQRVKEFDIEIFNTKIMKTITSVLS